jgi:hypothetical protein
MNSLYTDMTFNYPPGGEQLINILEVLGPIQRQSAISAMLFLGVSGDEHKAGLTIKNLIKFDILEESEGIIRLSTQLPMQNEHVNIMLFLFLKYAQGETYLNKSRPPASFAFTSNKNASVVYEVAVFGPCEIRIAAEYAEFRRHAVIVKPILALIEGSRKITAEDVKEILRERIDVIVSVFNEGEDVKILIDGEPETEE